MVVDIRDYAWRDASTFTEEAEKRQVLEWFVERARTGKTVNPEVMEFMAAGVEQHLAGKKPWGAKRGKKKRSLEQEMHDALPIYTAYQRIETACLAQGRTHAESVDPGYVLVTTAEEFGISEDTVKRAIDTVREHGWTSSGKLIREVWELVQFFKRWIKSPEGKAFLETPEGREMYKDSPYVHEGRDVDT